MRVLVFAALSCLLTACPAAAQNSYGESWAPTPPSLSDTHYRTCTADSDCVSVPFNPCSVPVSINRAYLDEVMAWNSYMARHVSCHVAKDNPFNIPACNNGWCGYRNARAMPRE